MLVRTAYLVAILAGLLRLLAACGPDGDHTEILDYGELGTAVSGISATQGVRAADEQGRFCLDAKDDSPANGTHVQLWECHNGDNQGFRLDGDRLKVYANRCASPGAGRSANGSTVRIYLCDPSKVAQRWVRDGGMLRWGDSGKCLDVTDGDAANGTLLQLWDCDKVNPNQQFLFAGQQSSAPAPSQQPADQRLDLSKWRQETYRKGMFNEEEQRYTNGNRNVEFRGDGTTVITARKENGEWTSARLTGDEVGDLPAYYEAKITLPSAKGTWPAFWLTSRGAWPQGGEIDIMEQVNGDGKTHWSNHWGANSGKPTFNTHESMGGLDLSKPHTYGGYITDKGVQFYVDGKPVGKWVTYPAESNWGRIARAMVPIVNLAMGGNWPGNIPGNVGTQTMTVHWVTKAKAPPKI